MIPNYNVNLIFGTRYLRKASSDLHEVFCYLLVFWSSFRLYQIWQFDVYSPPLALSNIIYIDRASLYVGKDSHVDQNTYKLNLQSSRNFPFICDFNPDLLPVGKYINKHTHLLKLDHKTSTVINPDNIFVSFRGNRKIKETLERSKLEFNEIVVPIWIKSRMF